MIGGDELQFGSGFHGEKFFLCTSAWYHSMVVVVLGLQMWLPLS